MCSAGWRDQLGDVALYEVPAHRVAQGVMQDPVQLQHRGGGEAGVEPARVELLEMERAEPRQPEPSDGRHDMDSDHRFVALPGRESDGSRDALEPGLEELLCGDLFVGDELAGAMVAERLGELLGDLGAGSGIDVLALPLAVLPAKVGHSNPTAILAPVDAALACAPPAPDHVRPRGAARRTRAGPGLGCG